MCRKEARSIVSDIFRTSSLSRRGTCWKRKKQIIHTVIFLIIFVSLYNGKIVKESNSKQIETSIIVGQVNVSFCIKEETVTDCETRVSESGRLPEEHLAVKHGLA